MSSEAASSSRDCYGLGDPPQLLYDLPSSSGIQTTGKEPNLPVDILLLTVENDEFLACYQQLKNPCRWWFDGLGYVYFEEEDESQKEKVKIALLKCYGGSGVPGGSLISVKIAVTVLRPKAVISVGACSGLNPEKTKLGDVILSSRLSTYASKVVMSDQEQSTGLRTYVSKQILNVIKNCADGWQAPLKNPKASQAVEVHCGEILSGPEKIQAECRRDQLTKCNLMAMAVVMEGEGVFTAAFDSGIEWLIVKGIADYAGSSSTQQNAKSWRRCASVMAASLVMHILSNPTVFCSWPHYKESVKGVKRSPEYVEVEESAKSLKSDVADVQLRLTQVEEKQSSAEPQIIPGRKRKDSQELDGMIEDKKARNIFSHLQDLQSDTVLVSNKTNPLSDLRKIALDKGFVISDNPASGNCLFYALSEQLKSVKAIHTSHKEVREALVQFLTANAYLRDGTPLFNFVSGYPSWPEYLQSMAEDGTWGDHMVLLAAANYFQSPIRIISSRDHEIVVQPDHAVADINPLVLGHVHEFHYVSLHPSQESIPSYVLARGQTAIAAFIKAKADGWTLDKRVKVLLIGQDRVGKTSVGRSLKGEKFRANEISTEGVQMYEPLKNPGDQPWKNYVLQHETTAFHHKSAAIISREVQLKSTGGQTPKKGLGTESQKSSNLDATADNSQNSKQTLTLQSSMDTYQKDSPSEFSNLSRPHPFEEEGTASLHSTSDNEQKVKNTSSNERELMDNKIADLTAEKLHRKETDIPDGIWPVIWDFAGQALFRAIHPIFMSSAAVYVLVWDLTRDLFAKAQCKVNEDGRGEVDVLTADGNDTNLDHILRWLDMVHSLRPEGNSEFPPVILVGTHADEVNFPDKKKEELEEFLKVNFEDYYNHVVESVTMDNTLAGRPIQEEDKRICQLRQITLKEAEKLSHTQKKIPLKWLEVENKVCDHIKKSEDKYMTKQSFKEKIVDQICQPDRDQNLAEHILNFMHDRGTIVYLDHTETPNGLVVLDPQWLVHDVLCKIVTIKNRKDDKPEIKRYRRNLKEKGILNVALLNYACENLNLDGIKKHLILIMRKFNLLCENTKDINGETEYLVPCMLTRKLEKDLTCDDRQVVCEPVFITFDTEYVPFGLFSRILVLFGQWAASRTSCERPQLFANAARFFIAKTTSLSVRFDCFKRVIKIFVLKGAEPNPMHNDQQVLLQASRFLRQILERLKQECHWLRRVSLRLCAQCKLCLKNKNCLWHKEQKCSHEDCTHYVDINDKPFVCVNDLSSNSALPQTWIQALANGMEDVKQCIKVKKGTPSKEELERLSQRIPNDWKKLGRRLEVEDSQLIAFDKENDQCCEKGYSMLMFWKQRDFSGATYQVLYDALCHELVQLKELAEKFCCV